MSLCGTGPTRPVLSILLCTALGVANVARAQDKQEQISVANADRTFVVHLPSGYEATEHYPVVLVFHGRQQDADEMARLSRFNEVADRYGIIAVYPNATQGRWNFGVSPQEPSEEKPSQGRGGYPGRRGDGGIGIGFPGAGGPMGRRGGGPGRSPGGRDGQQTRRRQQSTPPADDIAFVSRLLDKLSSSYAVDGSRIYATGLSDGGFMDFNLGCRLANRIAAIAPVGAEMPKTLTCVPSRLLPVLMINGTSDPVVPYKGGSGRVGSFATLSAPESAERWARLNNCDEKPKRTTLPPRAKGGKKTQVDTYSCKQGAQVVLYSLKDGGNTWPSGQQYMAEKQVGKTSGDLNASETIWRFLQSYQLPTVTPNVAESN